LGLKKFKFIPNGFPKSFLKINSKFSKNVIFMGRIAPVKNLELILYAAKKLPEVNFTIYGPIEKGYVLKSRLKNVKIINKGYDQKEEIRELKKNSIFVLPSKREGIPLALMEAMAAGLVCISSNTQGGKELITHEKTGLLFKKENSEGLIKSLEKVISSKKEWKKLSINSKNSIKSRTWENISEDLEKIYKSDIQEI